MKYIPLLLSVVVVIVLVAMFASLLAEVVGKWAGALTFRFLLRLGLVRSSSVDGADGKVLWSSLSVRLGVTGSSGHMIHRGFLPDPEKWTDEDSRAFAIWRVRQEQRARTPGLFVQD